MGPEGYSVAGAISAWNHRAATTAPVSQYAEGYADAVEIIAVYVEEHCVDGETHANAVRTMLRPSAAPVSRAGLTDEQIREIAKRYAIFVSPGVYDITKYDCEEDFLDCARALAQSAPLNEGGSEPVAEWQSRYMGDPRQPGYWALTINSEWAQSIYYNNPNHTDEHGWEVRPLYAAPQPVEINEGGKGEGVAWSVTGATVRVLAAELIRAAESMGEDSDELTIAVKRPGTVADDDGATNQRHILAVSLPEYPEEGVYPVDPADPTGGRVDAAPQPSAKALTDEQIEELAKRHTMYPGGLFDVKSFARALLADHSRDVAEMAAEQPSAEAELRLDSPAQVGNARFGKGTLHRLVIEAAQRHHAHMNTPEKEADRIARGEAFVNALRVGVDAAERPNDKAEQMMCDIVAHGISVQWIAPADFVAEQPKALSDEQMLAAFNSADSVIDGLHEVLRLATFAPDWAGYRQGRADGEADAREQPSEDKHDAGVRERLERAHKEGMFMSSFEDWLLNMLEDPRPLIAAFGQEKADALLVDAAAIAKGEGE
jgi:hypothetical protein